MFMHNSEKNIIVSFTSYPARIKYVEKVLSSLFVQTFPAKKIVLYLSKDEFPEMEKELPYNLKILIGKNNFEIRWVSENLKPHKKWIYAFRDFPNDLVITVDDDVYYPKDMIETLYESYKRFPNCVSALRTHQIAVKDNKILPYRYWIYEDSESINRPSLLLFATGAAGVLYPVDLFDSSLFDENLIKKLCLCADDIWLKYMELSSDIPVVLPRKFFDLNFIDDSQKEGLCYVNNSEDEPMNDIQIHELCDYLKSIYGTDIFTEKILSASKELDLQEELYKRINKLELEVKSLQKKLDAEKRSLSYRVGSFITLVPRRIKTLCVDYILKRN